MDGTRNPILANDLHARLGTASAPMVLNVRPGARGADDRVIVGAVACKVASELQRLDGLRTGTRIVVHRARGGELRGPQLLRARLASPETITTASPVGRGAGCPASSTRPR
jgi:hypothetical protein